MLEKHCVSLRCIMEQQVNRKNGSPFTGGFHT
jgi:hypothetical protein